MKTDPLTPDERAEVDDAIETARRLGFIIRGPFYFPSVRRGTTRDRRSNRWRRFRRWLAACQKLPVFVVYR